MGLESLQELGRNITLADTLIYDELGDPSDNT